MSILLHGTTSPCKGEVGREAAGRGSARKFSRTLAMTRRARELRDEMTDAERKLWRALRRNQIAGLAFRRQHPIGKFTLDFYCPALLLAIEIDGGQHGMQEHEIRDRRRTSWLASKGISVIRFWNNEVLANTAGVIEEIVRIATTRTSQTPSPALPLAGGGRSGGAP